jgi:hypothetical protein
VGGDMVMNAALIKRDPGVFKLMVICMTMGIAQALVKVQS